MAKPTALSIWHTPRYLAALQRAEAHGVLPAEDAARHRLGTTMNPYFPEMYRRPATGAGGSLLAAELLAKDGVIYHPGGGTHHGMPDFANGFCYLNDVVLAVLGLKRAGARRVAYIDIDAHHCDGVAHAFAEDPNVLVLSVHEENRWPRTGQLGDCGPGTHVNLPLPAGANDTEMLFALLELALPWVQAFGPDAIVLQCGSDAVREDPQSRMATSNRAHLEWVRALWPLAPRYLVTGGGGYNPWSVARLWTAVWGTLSDRDLPERLPLPAQEVLHALIWDRAGKQRLPEPHWITTLLDSPREGPVRDKVRASVRTLNARRAVWV